MSEKLYRLGIDIGSTTVKIAIIDKENNLQFSDYERHYANIRETLKSLLEKAYASMGNVTLLPMITGSGGLTLAKHLEVPFVQEVLSVSTALETIAPLTDVAIELGGEDAKIIYFEGGNVEQRMNGICAGGTGSFIDQMASLLQTDATGLNEYAKDYKSLYTIAARCGVFAKSDIQPLINDGATKEDLSASIFQAVVNQPFVCCSKVTVTALKICPYIRGFYLIVGQERLFRQPAPKPVHMRFALPPITYMANVIQVLLAQNVSVCRSCIWEIWIPFDKFLLHPLHFKLWKNGRPTRF